MSGQASIIVVSTLLAGFALGCGADPAPTPNTAASPAAAAAMNPAPRPVVVQVATFDKPKPGIDSMSPSYGIVHIEDRIVKACGDIPTMHFAFDSADIDSAASSALVALARCFTTGALAGHGMKLVGHADTRGETEYNFGLGQKRAGSVAEFLEQKGLESERVSTTSHGEMDAIGTDEDGWAQDRHVEVLLAE